VLICDNLDELPALAQPLHLALGVFDGVHIGHQAVIARAIEAAKNEGGLAGLVTFDPHPIRVIAPGKAPTSLLATLQHKAEIVRELGITLFIPLHFDPAMAALDPAEFIKKLVAGRAKTIAVGEDWRFGHHRSGDVTLLKQHASVGSFQLAAVPPVMFDGERISSSRIRQAIRDGNLTAARGMLGRPYAVSGIVVEGQKLGRTLGFPTANIQTNDAQLPPDGVWAVITTLADGREMEGVANLGKRPSVVGSHRALEVHLFDFTGDLYGQACEVQFEKWLRDEIRFDSLDGLKFQIQQDTKTAKAYFHRDHSET
jgi:riboflavin kinase / FMN adenylyltransferase